MNENARQRINEKIDENFKWLRLPLKIPIKSMRPKAVELIVITN